MNIPLVSDWSVEDRIGSANWIGFEEGTPVGSKQKINLKDHSNIPVVYSLFFSVLAWYPISYSWDVATPLLSCLWKFILGDLAEWQKDSWWSEQTLFEFKTGMGQKVGKWIRRLAHDVITRGSHTI